MAPRRGIGVGVQLVTIDSYLVELVPKTVRGKAFAVSYGVMYLGVPTAACSAGCCSERSSADGGWRWVASFAAVSFSRLWVRRLVPESPRWLLQRGRLEAAETVWPRSRRVSLPICGSTATAQVAAPEMEGQGGFAELLRPTYRRRTLMLLALNIFQAWFLRIQQLGTNAARIPGVTFVKSLEYSFGSRSSIRWRRC